MQQLYGQTGVAPNIFVTITKDGSLRPFYCPCCGGFVCMIKGDPHQLIQGMPQADGDTAISIQCPASAIKKDGVRKKCKARYYFSI